VWLGVMVASLIEHMFAPLHATVDLAQSRMAAVLLGLLSVK
jgi:hypothetical protein